MQELISITSISSISALGAHKDDIWNAYQKEEHCITNEIFEDITTPVARLTAIGKEEITQLRAENTSYKNLDDSVLYAIYTARKAVKDAGWNQEVDFGINFGSSRGATSLFEKYHEEFLKERRSSTLSSPTTTLGNISSWVSHDLQHQGPEISHSITCSTALHALINGVAWLKSGLTDKFLVGGSEAPLTPFTIAQMKALKIYAKVVEEGFPCKALDLEKSKNTMFLGEGAAAVCLEKGITEKSLAIIKGIGYATEPLKHNISISTNADCFQKSMKMAMKDTALDEVDAIVMHAPGTIKGDTSEYNAIKEVFGNEIPAITTNKWKIGHTFGASGILSLELAIFMLLKQEFIAVPYINNTTKSVKKINKVMVNAVGFGGNAVSILLSKI